MSRRGGPVNLSKSNILYVGLVPFEWDENTLRSVVCGSGNVVDVRLGFDYAGKNKGFSFVEYSTPEEAAKALQLLSQIQISTGNNKSKRLRVELSKEGLRANSGDRKQILQLNRSYLPPNVHLPPEMMNGTPMNQMNMNQMNMNQMNMNQMNMNQMNMNQMAGGMASRNLPQPPNLPFTAPDKISENLSHIPPAQLIELIANLKTVLAGPNASRAPDVFQLSPLLATSAAQALLLMGFIDNEVIKDSMNAPQLETTPQLSQQQLNSPQAPLGQFPPMQQQPFFNNSPAMNQPPMAGMNNYSNVPPNLPPAPNSAPTKWPFLPVTTQQKLAAMAPEQADLIAQVLTIPPEQIPALEPDKQAMVSNLRAQYL